MLGVYQTGIKRTPSGDFLFSGAVIPYASSPRNGEMPRSGKVAQIGSSTTANSFTATLGVTLPSARSTVAEALFSLYGGAYTINGWGYASQANAVILTHLDEVYAWGPDILVLQLGANDLSANTVAAAETAFATLQSTAEDAIKRGIYVITQTPHYNGSNWKAALHYDTLCQEWGASAKVPVISGVYAIAAKTDLVGTAKSGAMADTLHVSDIGARAYGAEGVRSLKDGVVRRILSGGNTQVESEFFKNPRMVGSTAVSGTGFSGTGPTDWGYARSGSVTTTVSVGSDDEGPYVDLSMVSTADNEYITVRDSTFAAALAAFAPTTFRAIADYEVVTPGACENVRIYLPFTAGIVQLPNASSSSFTGTLATARRQLVTPPLETAIFGTAFADQPGIRISFSGAGTSVIRLRGISARYSRW